MGRPSTFEHYLDRLDVRRHVADGALTHDRLVEVIRRIDTAVAAVEGRGFEPTPFTLEPELAASVGLPSGVELWVKDESHNVSGSHKARHLFGVAVEEAVAPSGDGPFAIASCGNAALGAAVVALAVSHPLDVFVPEWANEAVVARIEELGGRVVRCPREQGVLGDPSHHAMVAAIAQGAVAFSCQGTDTPTTIDGGRTIAYEIVDTLVDHAGEKPVRLDRIFVQVGGGALGTAVITGLDRSSDDLVAMPTVHAVQPEGNHPLVRAWDRVIGEFFDCPVPVTNAQRGAAAEALGAIGGSRLEEVGQRLETGAARYMTPWEDEPVSYASGILDDVTYDWIPLVEAMLSSGGHPIVAGETDLRLAHRLAHAHTEISVCPTGAAGLGGLIAVQRDRPGTIADGERVAVLFTGQMRPGDPDPLAH